MKDDANNFTDERIKELRENIDLSDVPEIESMERFQLRNYKQIQRINKILRGADNNCSLKNKKHV